MPSAIRKSLPEPSVSMSIIRPTRASPPWTARSRKKGIPERNTLSGPFMSWTIMWTMSCRAASAASRRSRSSCRRFWRRLKAAASWA
ncbi:MAG: hypothetical protein NTX64_07420, partial [Elusimicrobia bacterium]|nr:hypothetical protein [Elusimicrobiota bacterium]